jgi:uncharacterized protein
LPYAWRNRDGVLCSRRHARYCGGSGKKDDAADVTRIGFKAMKNGEGDVVSGWHNKLQSAIANITPASVLAEIHRKKAAPGSATH